MNQTDLEQAVAANARLIHRYQLAVLAIDAAVHAVRGLDSSTRPCDQQAYKDLNAARLLLRDGTE